MRPLARLRGGGELIPLSLGQYWFIAVGSAFSIFIATSPRAFLDAYKVTGPVNPVPADNSPTFELIKLIMKWWSSAIAGGPVAVLTSKKTGMSETDQKNLLFYLTLFYTVTGSFLTVANYRFGAKISGDNVDMGPVVFNMCLQVFNMAVAYLATAK